MSILVGRSLLDSGLCPRPQREEGKRSGGSHFVFRAWIRRAGHPPGVALKRMGAFDMAERAYRWALTMPRNSRNCADTVLQNSDALNQARQQTVDVRAERDCKYLQSQMASSSKGCAKMEIIKLCAHCGAGAAKKSCGRCGVYYCNAACQKAHWPAHKPKCTLPARATFVQGS